MNNSVQIVQGPLAALPQDPSGSPAWASGGGAVVCFEGTVRPEEAGRPIIALDYEVYEPMAGQTLARLADEVGARFGLIAICVEHSRGRVPAGQCAFRLRVSATHRQEALAAMAQFIDRVKQDVPIWKTPVFVPPVESPCPRVPASPRPLPASPHWENALTALLAALAPVGVETVAMDQACGRVLAEPLLADRDSPAADVSAMDGFAVRVADLAGLPGLPGAIDVGWGAAPGEALSINGRPVAPLEAGRAMRIATGAAMPFGADAVVPREQVSEQPGRIVLGPGVKLEIGQHIRRQGENIQRGGIVLAAGRALLPATISAAAAFGADRLAVHRKVRVSLIITGDEWFLASADVRDSNGPALTAMLGMQPWIDLRPVAARRAGDDPAAIAGALSEALADCDAVFLTGGVSMGERDHVRAAVAAAGARIVFHKLAIRPGKPILGAVGPAGQVILGLPGNPVSVLVTARRFGMAALGRLAGLADPDPPPVTVRVATDDGRRLPLTWFRLVRLTGPGTADLVPEHGSGDVVAAARSDGFVQVDPDAATGGPGAAGAAGWPFYAWGV